MATEWTSPDGAIRLINADCLDVLPAIEAGSVDAVVTDPPYAIPTVVAACRETSRTVGDLSIVESAFRGIFDLFGRATKPTGRFFVFCDGTSYPVIFRSAYGKFSQALLVWNKGRIGMGREFRKSHELVMHCWKNETPVFSDGVGRADVISIPPVGTEREHGAQKPVELIEVLLAVCGASILDPFMGSGSTALACIRTRRRFIGIEIDPAHYATAVRRCEAELARHPLFS